MRLRKFVIQATLFKLFYLSLSLSESRTRYEYLLEYSYS